MEVIAAAVPRHVQHFSGQIEAGTDGGGKIRANFIQRNTAACDLSLFPAQRPGDGKAPALEGGDDLFHLASSQLFGGGGGVDGKTFQKGKLNPLMQQTQQGIFQRFVWESGHSAAQPCFKPS